MPERRLANEAIFGIARPLRPASPPPLGVVPFGSLVPSLAGVSFSSLLPGAPANGPLPPFASPLGLRFPAHPRHDWCNNNRAQTLSLRLVAFVAGVFVS